MSVIAGVLGRAGERGQARRKRDAERGICTWRNPSDVQKWMDDEQSKAVQAREAAREERGAGGADSRSIL